MDNKLKNTKAVLFDLNETLVVGESSQTIAFDKTLKFFNINSSFRECFYKLERKNIWQIEEDLIEAFNLKITKEQFRAKKQEFVSKILTEEKTLSTHYAKELVSFLSTKYPLAICSAASREEILLKLKNVDLLKYFKVIVSANDVERLKPFPDVYIKGAEGLGLKPNECLAIEDSLTGVKAAKAAGAICIAIPSKNRNTDDFTMADMVLDSLEDVYNYFNK